MVALNSRARVARPYFVSGGGAGTAGGIFGLVVVANSLGTIEPLIGFDVLWNRSGKIESRTFPSFVLGMMVKDIATWLVVVVIIDEPRINIIKTEQNASYSFVQP